MTAEMAVCTWWSEVDIQALCGLHGGDYVAPGIA